MTNVTPVTYVVALAVAIVARETSAVDVDATATTAATTTNRSTCDGDVLCTVNAFCRDNGVNCHGVLSAVIGALDPTTHSVGSTAINYTTLFISLIVILKCIIVGLASLLAKIHCQRKRERRDASSLLLEMGDYRRRRSVGAGGDDTDADGDVRKR